MVAILLVTGTAWVLWPTESTKPRESEENRPTFAPGRTFSRLSSSLNPRTLGAAPKFELRDQHGTRVTSDSLLGKVWFANFMFTRCQATCPVQTANLKRLKESLSTDPSWPAIRLLSITVDPEYDTSEVLREYSVSNGADDSNWSFLTGPQESVWRLSKEGFQMPVGDAPDNADMPIAHDSRAILVDRLGNVRAYIDLTDPAAPNLCREALALVIAEFDPGSYFESEQLTDTSVTHIAQPPEILDTESWLSKRQEDQAGLGDRTDMFCGFSFTDVNAAGAAGIDFVSQIVDEQRWRLQVNHYDHGNGVCVADVDGDGLLDLYFTSQAGANGLWRNLGKGRFEDVTDHSGTGLPARISVTASFADIDGDGDQDLYVTTIRDGNVLFDNDGTGKFTDISVKSGLDYRGHSSSATFFDYDRDGLLDMFLCNVGRFTTDERIPVRVDRLTSLSDDSNVQYFVGTRDAFAGHLKPELNESSRLFRNTGDAVFTDVTESVGLIDDAWSGDASPVDVNGDQWPDLFVLNMQGNDEYFENIEGQRFVRRSRDVFPRTSWGAMGIKVFDFDNDEDMDIFVTDMHSDMSEDVLPDREDLKSRMQWPESFLKSDDQGLFGNSFFRNDGNGVYVEVSDKIGAENYWPWGLSVGDLNADGFQDAFVASSMNFPYRYGVNSVLLNDHGREFHGAECLLGVEPRANERLIKPWFTCDCDGIDQGHPICHGRSGEVVVWSARGTRSSVIFDLDDDGDLDIVTNEFNDSPMVLLSDLAERQKSLRFVKIRLSGDSLNRDGLGATVRLKTNLQTQIRVNDGKSGYLSQSSLPLYFGLADNEQIQQITVDWPSGKQTVRTDDLDVNRLHHVSESD